MSAHVYAIGIFLFVAMMNACVKALDHALPLSLVLASRFVIGLIVFAPWIHHLGGFRRVMKTDQPLRQVGRAILSLIGIACGYYAAPLLPLGDANALWQSCGFFLLLLSVPMLGEKIQFKHYLICALGFAGTLLIAQPHGTTNFLAVALVLASAFIAAITTLTVRLMSRKDADMTIMAWFFSVGSVVSLLWYIGFSPKNAITLNQGLLLFGAGFFGCFSQFCMTRAFKMVGADVVASYTSSGVLFSLLLGYMFFSETPTVIMLIGALMIVTGIQLNYAVGRKDKKL